MDVSTIGTLGGITISILSLQSYWINKSLGKVEASLNELTKEVAAMRKDVTRVDAVVTAHVGDERAHVVVPGKN